MDELRSLVERAKNGDLDAFSAIVGRFQDMALGYAYSVMGDFHLAEDVAQEAFVQAYQDLGALREPDAFPGWFRRIVYKHCDRVNRGKRLETVPLESVVEAPSGEPGPAAVVEKREMREAVLQFAVEKDFKISSRWSAVLEAKATGAWARVPIAGGHADVPNIAFHLMGGLQYGF